LPQADATLTGTTVNGSDTWSIGTLSAPDPLTCAWTGTNSLSLTWTNTSGSVPAGYTYERSNSSGSGYATLGTTSGSGSVTATDSNPSPPTLRYYRVTTTNGSWTSAYTAVSASNTCDGTITSLYASGTVSGPFGVAVDSSGNVYTADSGGAKVIKTTPGGTTTTYAGTGTAGYSGDGGAATSAKLNLPWGLAFDSSGNLYIADSSNNRVRKVTTGGTISTVAGTGAAGFSGDGGAATAAKLDIPAGIAFDASGNMYIAEQNNDIVRKVTSGGTISTFAGTTVAGYSGDGGAATSAKLTGPYGVVVDSAGVVYIADTGNNVIRKVTTGGTISTVAGGGASSACSFSGTATSVSLNGPQRLAYDATTDRVFIADRLNHCVRALSSATISRIAGTGTAGYSGDNGPAVAATMNGPSALAYSSTGDLYIADTSNNVVRKVLQA
jgi:trimeric autotransporter adhesin